MGVVEDERDAEGLCLEGALGENLLCARPGMLILEEGDTGRYGGCGPA